MLLFYCKIWTIYKWWRNLHDFCACSVIEWPNACNACLVSIFSQHLFDNSSVPVATLDEEEVSTQFLHTPTMVPTNFKAISTLSLFLDISLYSMCTIMIIIWFCYVTYTYVDFCSWCNRINVVESSFSLSSLNVHRLANSRPHLHDPTDGGTHPWKPLSFPHPPRRRWHVIK